MNQWLVVPFAVLAAVALLLAAERVRARDDSTASNEAGRWSTEEVQEFDAYPVLWLGEEFQGLELTGSIRDIATDDQRRLLTRRDGFIFTYGDCDLGGSDGCAVPLAVRSTTTCLLTGESMPPSGIDEIATIRGGAKRLNAQSKTYVWTGDVVVSLSGDPTLINAAIGSLQVANPRANEPLVIGPRGELPPPAARGC